MDDKFSVFAIIFQYASAAALIALAVFYHFSGRSSMSVLLFAAVGALFIVIPTVSLVRHLITSKNKKKDDPPKKDK